MLDLILLFFFLIGFAIGYKNGFVRKLFSLIAFFGSFFVAFKFFPYVKNILITNFQVSETLSPIISILTIFFGVYIIMKLLAQIFEPKENSTLSFVNKMFGAIFGILQYVFFASFVLYILNFFKFPNDEIKRKSGLYNSVLNITPKLNDFVFTQLQEIEKQK